MQMNWHQYRKLENSLFVTKGTLCILAGIWRRTKDRLECNAADFSCVSRSNWLCITTWTRQDWFKKLAPLFRPIEVKPKPIVSRSHTFSRASRRLHSFSSSLEWFTGLFVSFVIGQNDYFRFDFTTLSQNPLYYLHLWFIVSYLGNNRVTFIYVNMLTLLLFSGCSVALVHL